MWNTGWIVNGTTVSRFTASFATGSSHMILDGVLKEGDPLPSVRNVAAEYRVNPLTVLKAYQQLVDEQLVETRRGLGMFVNAGARDLLLQGERAEVSRGRMAAGSRHHSAARPDAERTADAARNARRVEAGKEER